MTNIQMEARASVLKGLAMVGAPFEEADVSGLVAKVCEMAPKSPTKFGFVVARNWAVDQLRLASSKARRAIKRHQDEERERREREVFENFRAEFLELLCRLASTLTPTQQQWMGVVRLRCFEGSTRADLLEQYPGTNYVVIDQWKCRGVKLLRTHGASPELLQFVGRNRRNT